ncbi:hypothetical protein X772_35870 [Mesorhizobium sp. LSJC280B00]|nr:hypothetical protein X772_35870 [Mesorhizobium sp. LSJC280B00]
MDLGAGTADLTDVVVDRIEQGGGIAGAARSVVRSISTPLAAIICA